MRACIALTAVLARTAAALINSDACAMPIVVLAGVAKQSSSYRCSVGCSMRTSVALFDLASPIANAGLESITNGEDERELEFEPHISIGDGECNERCLDGDADRGGDSCINGDGERGGESCINGDGERGGRLSSCDGEPRCDGGGEASREGNNAASN